MEISHVLGLPGLQPSHWLVLGRVCLCATSPGVAAVWFVQLEAPSSCDVSAIFPSRECMLTWASLGKPDCSDLVNAPCAFLILKLDSQCTCLPILVFLIVHIYLNVYSHGFTRPFICMAISTIVSVISIENING